MLSADGVPDSAEGQEALRRLAEEAARAGGNVARQRYDTLPTVRLKADRSEVSEADQAAQQAVLACLAAQRPDDAVIAEEQQDAASALPEPDNERVCWVVDPIDGTRNYVRHIPLYACSVAAMWQGYPLVGAVYDPVRDVLYSASRTGGLFVNGARHEARPAAFDARRTLNPKPVVAIPSSPTGPWAAVAHDWLDAFVCRSLGATALHLALVATGELNGMLADNPRLWDVAAGWLLITAAGGRITTPNGEPLFPRDVQTCVPDEFPTLAGDRVHYSTLLAHCR